MVFVVEQDLRFPALLEEKTAVATEIAIQVSTAFFRAPKHDSGEMYSAGDLIRGQSSEATGVMPGRELS